MFVARRLPAFCTPWRVSDFLEHILRDFHVPWHWAFINRHEWWFISTQCWTRDIRQCISQDSRGGPRRALDRNVVSSGIAFTAFDLITRPSPFRATMCSSVWKRFPSHVPRLPPLLHDSSWKLPSNSEHHSCTECQEHTSMLTSLRPLIRRFPITRHMACVQNVRCVLDNSRKHRRVDGDRTPDTTRKINKNHSCHLLN